MVMVTLFQVLNGAVLQQVFVVEYVIVNQMCDDCHRVEAKDFWRACVQVRQKVSSMFKHAAARKENMTWGQKIKFHFVYFWGEYTDTNNVRI